jgi:thiol:disulfide interchange protein DsbD
VFFLFAHKFGIISRNISFVLILKRNMTMLLRLTRAGIQWFTRYATFSVLLTVSSALVWDWALAADFLPPEQAFAFSARAVDDHTVQLHWRIAPGYHLYRDQLKVTADSPALRWAPLALPVGLEQFDTNFNKTVTVYEQSLDVPLRLTGGQASAPLTVQWQGCADAGLCYPPQSTSLNVEMTGLGAARNQITTIDAPLEAVTQPAVATDAIASTLASGSLLRTAGVFLLAGLLLAFTPCVLPMVPILSSLIAGQSGPVTRRKGFLLSLAYSLGMALVYACFGVAAGLAGEGLAAALQNPWVLGGFALMLSAMALSMFGVYELQMPSAIQSKATDWSNRFKGGSLLGVFLMGGVSALVVGPCVAAPLAGALVYISQTRDVLLGGSALFAMALGMSVPLLLVGISAGSLLPRAGAWMERVKQVFGMMLLGVAIWMVTPVIAPAVQMLLWATWLLAGAALLGIFGAATPQQARPPVAAQAGGAGMLALAALLLVGAASGGQSVLQPLAHWRSSASQPTVATADTALKFERVRDLPALAAALAQSKAAGQAVMLDFYADWCVACKELETFTFSDKSVKQRLANTRLLQADVTANSAHDKALLKKFGLFGPPGIVLFDSQAQPNHTVVGYQNAQDFLASLELGLPLRP